MNDDERAVFNPACPIPLESRTASRVYTIETVSIVPDNGEVKSIELRLVDTGNLRLMKILITEIYNGSDAVLAQLARSNENRSDLLRRIQEEYEIIAIQHLNGNMYFLVPKVNHNLRTKAIETLATTRHYEVPA